MTDRPSFDPNTPIHRGDEYSPVQVRLGVVKPAEDSFPPYHIRVPQDPGALKSTLDEYKPLRVTLQASDVCQLACNGCYVKEWTDPNGLIRQGHDRIDTPEEEAADQIRALGPQLEDVYFLGVEPTLRPEMLRKSVEVAKEVGATAMSITNGASRLSRYEDTFREHIESGDIYKVLLSLDSIDPEINNRLRGKSFAHERTVATIKHAVENGDPIKVNVTVWPDNYHTVLDTAKALFDMGVRGFGFHCGSVEGIGDPDKSKLMHVDPLAWRALCSRLADWRDEHADELENFTLPYIFFTEDELRDGIIGDEDGYNSYKQHLGKLAQGVVAPSPVKVCPSLAVPQVYVFSNDGRNASGAVSLCNVHTIGANKKHDDAYFADYTPETKTFDVRQDEEHNELVIMRDSPHLCPAREYDMGDENPSDVSKTEAGDVYHACRYVSSNQFPQSDEQFGSEYFSDYQHFYQLWSNAVGRKNIDFSKLKAIHVSDATIAEKIIMIKELG